MSEKTKRKALFDYYRQRADIVCFQEVHSQKEDEGLWRSEWGGRILFSHGTASSRGICICFKRGLYCNITNISTDFEGRVLCCEININPENEGTITLCVIYAPNKDTPVFFDALSQRLADYTENVILIGDFNLVQNIKLDRYGSQYNNTRSLQRLKELCDEFSLSDTWRVRNENTLRYSWSRRKPHFQASRIDYALISIGLESSVQNICYLQSIMTDHSAMYISIKFDKHDRGPGYWKMNTSILTKADVINDVRKTITEALVLGAEEEPVERWIYIKKRARLTNLNN